MSRRLTGIHGDRSVLVALSFVGLAAAIGQVTLGGVVRVTGSGLGCPDWPLCHGNILPPLEYHILIEYSHRLSASVLGVVLLAATIVAWGRFRHNRWATVSTTGALTLALAAAVLGGVSVLTELVWWVVLFHLAIAEAVVACMVLASVASLGEGRSDTEAPPANVEKDWYDALVLWTLLGTFALIILGSYMVGLGYGASCDSWPLCGDNVLSAGDAYMVHMAHRIAAAFVGVLVIGTVVATWLRRAWRRDLLWASLIAAGVFLAQVALGAATVWTDFSEPLRAAHLSIATLAWVSLMYLAALNFVHQPSEPAKSNLGSGVVSGLEGAAP